MNALTIARWPVLTMYRVEVSGWDHNQQFFVEKAELHWDEDSGKRLLLRRELRNTAVLFVRLLQPTSAEHSTSVAYSAELLCAGRDGRNEFRLTQIQPR